MSFLNSIKGTGLLKWGAIFFGAAFLILLIHTCNQGTVKTYSQQYVDSLKKDAHDTAEAYRIYREESQKDRDKQDEIIKVRTQEKDKAVDALQKSSADAYKWQSLYKAAKENHDTVTMVYACDSINAELTELREATDTAVRKFQQLDSARDVKVSKLEFDLARAEKQIKADSILKKQLFAEIDQHIKKDKQQERKIKGRKFWRWVERVGIAAGSIFLTSKALK